MNKKTLIIFVVVIFIVAVIIAAILSNKGAADKNFSTLSIENAEDLEALIDKIYEGVSVEMPRVETQQLDVTDKENVTYYTGLENTDNVEYLVVSEPMMSSQPYSLVLVKVKDGANVNSMAEEMNTNIDESKWICVTADKIYTTTCDNVICLVMSKEEIAKPVFESFKLVAGNIGDVYERDAVEEDFPEEMF